MLPKLIRYGLLKITGRRWHDWTATFVGHSFGPITCERHTFHYDAECEICGTHIRLKRYSTGLARKEVVWECPPPIMSQPKQSPDRTTAT